MADSIFHESMRQGMTCFVLLLFSVFLVRGNTSVFLRIKEMESVLSLQHPCA